MEIHDLFEQHFGSSPDAFTVRAPGRVNLIGEHVDYNDGFVLPMALPLRTLMRIQPRTDRTVKLYSANFDQTLEFSLDEIAHSKTWIDYTQGVAKELAGASIPLHGFEGVVESDVPVASGLSSSAAIEVASCLAFLHLASQPMSPADVALLCQRAENKFIGVQSGIMDQMAVAACHQNHALLLDCRTLETEQVPFQLPNHSIVIIDSGAPRELASGAYNERVQECRMGLEVLQRDCPEIESLRDVSLRNIERAQDELPPVVLKRVRHVVSEIERTLAAVAHLKAGELAEFGACMNASHASLRDDYEVTSRELDWLCDWSQHQAGVLGSRMTGAGFGGCTVTLIEKSNAQEFVQRLPQEYRAACGREARAWICEAEDGARVL